MKKSQKKYEAKTNDYNTIDDIDDYMRGVMASDTPRINFNGN